MGVSERKADEYVGREAAIAAIFVRVGMRTIGTRLERVHAVEPYDFCSYGLKGESR